ncbi:BREX system P-loop protein BrxC [Caldibacillus debilis]|uniref:BREX system P-loop protein BrxC n=1 Tax=Caldibacillus debilis TaxID=301148 RepID=A0A150L915_9BACI|nr:BREX system P-loop protein BrxC [Caldibacillus debilis]KYD08755.1 hypothetical protein B4135_0437 [Caldibacillus debilis]
MIKKTLTIEEMFKKDIHRNINGVIQAGQLDEETIKTELEEFVMTREITENMELFYQNYVRGLHQPTTNIGVWISGFFGSGKSHFLKILSYLLDNKEIGGKKPVEYFYEKTDNQKLLDLMKQCAELPSDAILFNIDSKATTSGNEKEKIVEVFLRVFNEHLGYSNTLWIADIERQLADEGIYEDFKKVFEEIEGKPWIEERSKIRLKRKSFVQALQKFGYDEQTAIELLSGNKTFEISSSEFAKLLAKHCQSKGKDYRLVFFVDEVGQYIGDNAQLMLNLQTVVEDLGNYCKGQVWVCVTSQEKIDAVTNIKDPSYDFSKIQGRFETRINLSSANTDEVIKRRLLEKTDVAKAVLASDYDTKEQTIKNLLAFDRNRSNLRSGYRNREEFIDLYPFVPYQIELLQKVFDKIRKQGEGGAHLSRGERSLIKAFQEVAITLGKESGTRIANFAQFFPTITRFLDTSIISTIRRAEDRVLNHEGLEPFDLDVLKTLYMIKGVDEISATLENVTTLLIDSLDCVKNELERKVKASLDRLERAMLIEQHADHTYSFLSDEEQEVNREIKSERIEESLITEELGKYFYDEIFNHRKYRYLKHYDFDFNRRFDGYTIGQMSNPLTLQVYTEMNPNAAMESTYPGTLIMCLDPQKAKVAEEAMEQAKKIEAYVRRKSSGHLSLSMKKILNEKQEQIHEFEQKAKDALIEACKDATFFILGQERKFQGDPESQLNQAFELLVQNTYHKLSYIEEPVLTNNYQQIIKDWAQNGLQTKIDGKFVNHLAYDEVFRLLEEKTNRHERVTLKQLISHFRNVPFGWSEWDIVGLIAAMLHDGKVKLLYSLTNEAFDHKHPEFMNRLSRSTEREKVIVECQVEIPEKIRRDVARVLRDFFGQVTVGDTYDDVANVIREKITEKFVSPLEKIQERSNQGSSEYPYPGKMEILTLRNAIQNLLDITTPEILVQEFVSREEEMEEWLDKLDELESFYLKTPIERFDEAVDYLKRRKQDIEVASMDQEIVILKQKMVNILTMDRPYSEIRYLPQLIENLEQKLHSLVDQERIATLAQIEDIIKQIQQIHYISGHIDGVDPLIDQAIEHLNRLKQQSEITDSIATLFAFARQAQQIYQNLREKVEKKKRDYQKADVIYEDSTTKQTKVLEINDLLLLSGIDEALTLSSVQEIERFIEKLKRNLIDLSREFNIVIKRTQRGESRE